MSVTSAPSGARLRALTRAAARGHGGAPWYALFGDVYTYVFTAAVVVAMGFQTASQLGEGFHGELAGNATLAFDPGWLVTIGALAVAGPTFALLVRLGPVGVSGAGAVWWLPTPADRTSLLRPTAIGWVAGTAGLGGVVGLLSGALAGADVLVPVLSGLGLGALGAGIAIRRQAPARPTLASRSRSRVLARAADASLVVAVALWAVLAWLTPPVPLVPVAVAIGLVVLGVAVGAVAIRAVGQIPGAELIARGSRMQEATFAIRSLDLRGLGQVLTDTGSDLRRRSRQLRLVTGRSARWSPPMCCCSRAARGRRRRWWVPWGSRSRLPPRGRRWRWC